MIVRSVCAVSTALFFLPELLSWLAGSQQVVRQPAAAKTGEADQRPCDEGDALPQASGVVAQAAESEKKGHEEMLLSADEHSCNQAAQSAPQQQEQHPILSPADAPNPNVITRVECTAVSMSHVREVCSNTTTTTTTTNTIIREVAAAALVVEDVQMSAGTAFAEEEATPRGSGRRSAQKAADATPKESSETGSTHSRSDGTRSPSVTSLLLSRDASSGSMRDLTGDNRQGWNALHFAVDFRAVVSTRHLLEQAIFSPNSKDKLGRTPLHIAARHGDSDVVELLLMYGGEVSLRDRQGRSPITTAVEFYRWAAVATFLQHSEDATRRELLAYRHPERGMTALALACCSSESDEAAAAIAAAVPALVDIVDLQGRTPLHYAAEYGLSGTVHMLVEMSGGLLAARDTRGALPAHMAAHSGVLSVAECVLEATAGSVGPIATLKDGSGSTPLDYAARAQRESPSAEQAAIVALLEKKYKVPGIAIA